MSHSNTTQQDSLSEMEKHNPLDTETKESATSSPVPQEESSSQSKSKSQEELSAKTSSNSYEESKKTTVSASSLTRWMMLLKLSVEYMKAKIAKNLIDYRNRPPKILVYPNRKLKKVSDPIDFDKMSEKDIVKIVRKMGSALSKASYGGKLGIAAPQIGINKRVMIVQGAVMVNPEWQPSKAPKEQIIEGCYSVPNKLYKVLRSPYGWAKWYSIKGELREYKLNRLDSIIYQHELDHLNGLCCCDTGEPVDAQIN